MGDSHYPLGWTPDAVFAPGGTDEEHFVVWGAAYSIVGNGTTATRGVITQPAVADSLGAPLIQANTDYTVHLRRRAARHGHFAQQKILMLDYRDLDSAEDIAGRPPINHRPQNRH